MKTCTFEGCERKHFCRGYCTGHYQQFYRGQELKPLAKKWTRAARDKDGKVCRQCDAYKPYEEFHVEKRASDGKQTACKMCVNEDRRRRRAHERKLKALHLDYVARQKEKLATMKKAEG